MSEEYAIPAYMDRMAEKETERSFCIRNKAIFFDEINKDLSEIIFGETRVRIVHPALNAEHLDYDTYFQGVVYDCTIDYMYGDHILWCTEILPEGSTKKPATFTITDVDYAKYVRDEFWPVGRGFSMDEKKRILRKERELKECPV